MSKGNPDQPFDHDHPLHSVAGILASEVSGQLARPMRELREGLAMIVETLDRYIGKAEGPKPYPWKSLQLLRQDVADAYLRARKTARLASELFEAMNTSSTIVEAIDINRHIEAALDLVRHRVASHTELFIDLGSVPPVRAIASEMTLAMAKMLLCCADSARTREGSAISVKTRLMRGDAGDEVVIYVADNGAGPPAAAESARRTLEPIVHELGGSFDAVCEPGQGSVFECRLPVGRR